MAPERHLLFAVLAFEYEMLNLEQLQIVCRAWAEDKPKLLTDLLIEWHWLTHDDLAKVNGAVDRCLAKNYDNPRVGLNAVMVRPEVFACLEEIKDDVIQEVLRRTKPLAAQLVNDRYRLIDDFAYGGLGKIWLAEDTVIRRRIAFKELQAKWLKNTGIVDRFVEEIQLTGQLEHPGIVPIYDLGFREDGMLYYTMKYVKGVNMEDAIVALHELPIRSSKRHLAFVRLLRQFIAVCQAVGFAHGHRVLHRDLKPQNVMLGEFGETRVLDWGLAKLVNVIDEHEGAAKADAKSKIPVRKTMSNWTMGTDTELAEAAKNGRREVIVDAHTDTQLGHIMGTPAYMSPEQAQGLNDQLRSSTDIYSLGAILYKLLTNQHPANGTVDETLTQVISGKIAAPREIDPSIPVPLEAICLKAMEFEPTDRYRHALDLAADVEAWLADEPVSIHPDSWRERFRRLRKRHPKWVASCAVGLVMGFLALLGGMGLSVRHTQDVAAKNIALEVAYKDIAAQNTALENAKRLAERSAARSLDLAEKERSARKDAEQSADAAMRHLYVTDMTLAQTAWNEARVGEIVRLLKRHVPSEELSGGPKDLRGFEWQYWNRLIHPYQRSLDRHYGAVQSVAFSGDGKRLASASYDQSVKVWDVMAGREALSLKGHVDWVRCVAFNLDGSRLASASNDKTVRIWDAASGQPLGVFTEQSRAVTSVAFSPDGKWLASGSEDQTVKVWNAQSGQLAQTLKEHSDAVTSVAFSSDGKRLASGSWDRRVVVWDTTSGQVALTLIGHRSLVSSVAFDADGKRIASASYDGTVKVWDATKGNAILSWVGHADDVHSVAFSADGKRLATGSEDQTVKIWDAATGQETQTLKGHTGTVRSVAFIKDGKRLASASDDQTVKVWHTTSAPETLTLQGHVVAVTSVAFSADGKRLASASEDQSVRVWDATNGQESLVLKGHSAGVRCVAFNADGNRLASASADRTVKVWNATNGQSILTLRDHSREVTSVAFSSDGKRLASASSDKSVKVWDATNGQLERTLKGHTDDVHCVVFSSDGKRLASASEDQTVRVWDVASGQETLKLDGHIGAVHGVTFSRDGNQLASASWDQTVKVWDATTGTLLHTLKGHANQVESVAFSPDGKRLASASWDKTVKVWDVSSGQETLTLRGHTSLVMGVAFSSDGQRLASASYDKNVKMWDARPWTPELREQREALSQIQFLLDQGQPKAEWQNILSADDSLSDPVRERAMQFARDWK